MAAHYLLAIMAGLGCKLVEGQVYTFEDVPFPGNKSLQTLSAFYIYAREDAPWASSEPSYVKFDGLTGHLATANTQPQEVPHGLQVSLMKYSEFWNLIDPKRFCCDVQDVKAGVCDKVDQLLLNLPKKVPEESTDVSVTHQEVDKFLAGRETVVRRLSVHLQDSDVFSKTVPLLDTNDYNGTATKMRVPHSGVYIMVLSNCGEVDHGTISGSVIVRNSYGFLPGNEYPKLPFFIALSIVHSCMAAIWLHMLYKSHSNLFQIQKVMTVVLVLPVLDAVLWSINFYVWNVVGSRNTAMTVAALLTQVLKKLASYVFLLVASLGWGVTRPHLGHGFVVKLALFCFLYFSFSFCKEVEMNFRPPNSPSTLGATLWISNFLLNCGLLIWICRSLRVVIKSLSEQQQFDRLLLFQRLRCILVFALVMAAVLLACQMVSLQQSLSVMWKYAWLWDAGIPCSLFFAIHASMMYLWAPNQYSQIGASRQIVTALLPTPPLMVTTEPQLREDHRHSAVSKQEILEIGERDEGKLFEPHVVSGEAVAGKDQPNDEQS